MAFIALNAGINFESFDPKRDYMYLLLINTDHSKKTLQLHLHANVSQEAIDRNGPLFCGFYNPTTKSTFAFTEHDGVLASPLITLEGRQSILLQVNVNHQLEGFFQISLPARIISTEGGVIQSKSQSSRSITIGHQLSYVFNTTPKWKGLGYNMPSGTTSVLSQPPVFTVIKPEPGENNIDLRDNLPELKAGATDRESIAYITALSRDREAAQQDLGTFVRVASMMTADSVMRKNFNQMLRSNGINFELGSSEVDQSFSVSMDHAGLIGPKPEDPTPPPSPEVRDYLRALLGSTSLIGPKPEDPTPPPPSPEVRAYLRNLLNSNSLIGPKPEDPTPPPPHSAEVRAYLLRLLEG